MKIKDLILEDYFIMIDVYKLTEEEIENELERLRDVYNMELNHSDIYICEIIY